MSNERSFLIEGTFVAHLVENNWQILQIFTTGDDDRSNQEIIDWLLFPLVTSIQFPTIMLS